MRRSNCIVPIGWQGFAMVLAAQAALLVLPANGKCADESAAAPAVPAAADLGQVTEIVLENGRIADGRFTLAGRDAQQQLLVAA